MQKSVTSNENNGLILETEKNKDINKIFIILVKHWQIFSDGGHQSLKLKSNIQYI